jgi:insertion element IS1 protein InsB
MSSEEGGGWARAGVEVELDNMWSFVGNKDAARWLWHASDHHAGCVVASVVGRRADQVLLERQARLAPFDVTRCYSDKWAAYQRHLPPEQHTVGKRYLQKIERKHLTFRTRLRRMARQTPCCSRSIAMHDGVIGLFINRDEFGIALQNRAQLN